MDYVPLTPNELAERTFRYVAEQLGREDITVDTQVYRGAIRWTITVDHHQYHGKNLDEALAAIRSGPPPTCGACGRDIPGWNTRWDGTPGHRYSCPAGGYSTCFPKGIG